MKSLVFSTTPYWAPHHADTLEVVFRLLKKKKKVYFVSCRKGLKTCAPNPFNEDHICNQCIKVTDYTISNLLPSDVINLDLNLILKRFDCSNIANLDNLLGLFYKNMPIGRLVASQLSSNLKTAYMDISDPLVFSAMNELIENGIALYEYTRSVIIKYDIDEVYAWNGRRPSDGPSLYAASSSNKKYYSYICGGKINKIKISNAFSVHDLDIIKKEKNKFSKDIATDPLKRKAGIEYYSDYVNGKIKQVGYDYSYMPKEKGEVSITNKKLNLLVLTSSPDESIHLSEHFEFYKASPYEKMFSIFNLEKVLSKYKIFVRWHPAIQYKNKIENKIISKLENLNTEITHIKPDSNLDTYSILNSFDVVLSFGSTVGYYAALQKIPVILAGPISKVFNKSFYSAKSEKEVRKLLLSDLKSLPTDEIVAMGYWFNNFGTEMKFIEQIIPKGKNYVASLIKIGKEKKSILPK